MLKSRERLASCTDNPFELWRNCPEEFHSPENPWVKIAKYLRENEMSLRGWQFTVENSLAHKQCERIRKVLSEQNDDCVVIAGWMLSEILGEIPPEYQKIAFD